MSEINKSYRIRTKPGVDNEDVINLSTDLVQDYDTFEILSLDIKTKDMYKLHNSNYGVIIGRVIANNGFGIPNAKISIFIPSDGNDDKYVSELYPFITTGSKNDDGVRYNLLPNEKVDGCHQVVGTFPTKRYALDNDTYLDVFDKYYTYTTRTNNAGDYMICGVPVGSYTLHMDLDLSDCGILSQKPRDFVYKGYTIEQFESPTKFKSGTDYNNLSQIITQDQVVNVNPFWGNSELGETIGITRADINVNFVFETTCVFIGSIISDNSSNGFNKKCIPTDNMGVMEELVTGEGKIEMIRKTLGGSIEEVQIKGTKLINENGIWCYQIPMNLDYVITDEYGNIVPTDDPEKGIATRASVRFRISMNDSEENTDNFFRAKVLVPHNPQILKDGGYEDYDYEFGSYTRDDSFRDLFWNNVYSVKSYIPRIQKHSNWKKEKFSGIKACNHFGGNNPMPYNNIRIRLPLMFTIMCALIKTFIFVAKVINTVIAYVGYFLAWLGTHFRFFYMCKAEDTSWFWAILNGEFNVGRRCLLRSLYNKAKTLKLITLKDGLCPDLENWFFAPMLDSLINLNDSNNILAYSGQCETTNWLDNGNYCTSDDDDGFEGNPEQQIYSGYNILVQTMKYVIDEGSEEDTESIDYQNQDMEDETRCLTVKTDYLLPCIEMNLAQEYKVIKFDFYNDWINGAIYNPRWVRFVKRKVKFLGITWAKEKVKGCMDDPSIFSTTRKYVQQCAIGYLQKDVNGHNILAKTNTPIDNLQIRTEFNVNNTYLQNYTKDQYREKIIKGNNLHKSNGFRIFPVFGKNGGICHQATTLKGQYVYYLKPCEIDGVNEKKVNLFATDLILLGTFNDCDQNGIPTAFKHLTSTTYIMPSNLAETNMDTNGPLYAKDGGTICIGNGNGNMENPDLYSLSASVLNDGISVVSAQTLKNEIEYYKDAENYNISDGDLIGYSVFDDTMALTEAAGISWDYTGPGQGAIMKDYMYYPGGHFLGLTCVNSETNAKSCINLSRICEIGVNKSQGHDDVRRIDTENGTLKYTYSVPTGFISGDEIVDTDFRSMFATMNNKRLIATKRQKNTGYKYYDFDFYIPTNFDGTFQSVVNKSPSLRLGLMHNPYNSSIDVYEENLSDYGIFNGSSRTDYDPEESANTQTRTREYTNLDYYMFRFGLSYEDFDRTNFNTIMENKFLLNPWFVDNKYYLPQYENSYYFYFGLKNGATAIDEFNKQFYSECDNLLITKKPLLKLSSNIDICEGTSQIYVKTEGMTLPYQSIIVYNNSKNETEMIIDSTTSSTDYARSLLFSENFYIPYNDTSDPDNTDPYNFIFGNYTVTIVDYNGIDVSDTISLGQDAFTFSYKKYDFNIPISGSGLPNNSTRSVYDGGFVHIYNIKAKYEDIINEDEQLLYEFKLIDEYGTEYVYKEDENEFFAFAVTTGVNYTIVVSYKCDPNPEVPLNKKIYYDTISFNDNSNLKLIFSDDKDQENILEINGIMSGMNFSWWWDNNHYDIGAEQSQDTENRLFFRKHFFKANDDKKLFNSEIEARKGQKVIWGTPQSLAGQLCCENYCSENPMEITQGYVLDDEYVYYPTYGNGSGNCSSCNTVFQFSSQVINGSKVGGYYHGVYQSGVTDSTTGGTYPLFNDNDLKYYHEGYGCIVKSIFDDTLFFTTFTSGSTFFEELNSYNIKRAIIYPSFIYPIMKRPFYSEHQFVRWSTINMYGDFYDENEGSPIWYFDENGKYAYIKIHNGITYKLPILNQRFSKIDWGFDLENLIYSVEGSDTSGLTINQSIDRLCNITNTDSDEILDTYETSNDYLVVEQGKSLSQSGITYNNDINVFVPTKFYDSMSYKIGDSKLKSVFFKGESTDVAYYIGKLSLIDIITGTGDTNFLYVKSNTEPDRYYVKYIKDGPHEIQPTSSTGIFVANVPIYLSLIQLSSNEDFSQTYKGKIVVAELYVVPGGVEYPFVHVTFEYENESGETQQYNHIAYFPNNNNDSVQVYLNKVLDNAFAEGTFNAVPGIYSPIKLPFKPILKYSLLKSFRYNGTECADFKEFFDLAYSGNTIYKVNGNFPEQEFAFDPSYEAPFGIGVKIVTNEVGGGLSYSYKVYPNVFENTEQTIITIPTNYLTFTAKSNNSSVGLTTVGEMSTQLKLQYMVNDDDNWIDYVLDNQIDLSEGDNVKFRGNNYGFGESPDDYYKFIMTGEIEASGDITSLNNAIGGDCLLTDFCYCGMFEGCTGLTTAPELPATTLTQGCYEYMFNGCTSLTRAPELPAQQLANNCYQSMFNGCTSLTTAPELPATELADYCYSYMFYGCTNLNTVPNLKPTTTAEYCCYCMFQECTSLINVPNELPSISAARSCYQYMFYGCTSLTRAPELPATILAKNCYAYMFYGCTSLTTAPDLPATTLAESCYLMMFRECIELERAPLLDATTLDYMSCTQMFSRCTRLTTPPTLHATTLADSCYASMFAGCTSLTTAPELTATILTENCYLNMFGGCISLTTAPELPAMTLAMGCYQEMFSGCTSLTSAPSLPATTLAMGCYQYMFYGCTSLTEAPELPATNLNSNCYRYMFYGCSSLNYIKAKFTTVPSIAYTANWVNGVSQTGTFVKNANATWDVTGVYGIPVGWTVETKETLTPSAIIDSSFIGTGGTINSSSYQDIYVYEIIDLNRKYYVTANYTTGFTSYVANYYDSSNTRIGTEYLQNGANLTDALLTIPNGTSVIKCNFRKQDVNAKMKISYS